MPTIEDGVEIYPYRPPADQAHVQVSSAPAQNAWVTLLATTRNVEIDSISIYCAVNGETIELRVIADGITSTAVGTAQALNTYYYWRKNFNSDGWEGQAAVCLAQYYQSFKAKVISIEYRKTTAAGATTITADLNYHRYLP